LDLRERKWQEAGGKNCIMQSFTIQMRCGYEVPGMILLQACLYTYSLLRGVTFEVLPLSSYALSPTILPLLETFVELLLCNCFQCHYHFFWVSSVSWSLCPFKADFIFGNSQKSFKAKSGEQYEYSISVIDFWARNCLTVPCVLEHCHGGESTCWAKVQAFSTNVIASLSKFSYIVVWYCGWLLLSSSSMFLWPALNCLCHLKTLDFFIASPH
jgi:hypothetical protein